MKASARRISSAAIVLVEALDRGDFLLRREGQFLDRGEALGHQQAGDHVVHVQRLDEQAAAAAELFLAALALLGLGQDVDVPAGELARQPHVLAAPADRERELLVRHHDLDAAGFLVHHHLGDFGRRQRVHHEGRGLRRPGDDVDLLALQLLHHRLHARAAHADAGADRIDRASRG